MNGFNTPSDSTPLPYTWSPVELLLSELHLIKDILFYHPASIPGILQPFWSWNSEDELCLLNPRNVKSLLLHGILILTQSLFLVAVVYALVIPVPAGAYLAGIILSLVLNYYFCKLLNGDGSPQVSHTDLSGYPTHPDEHWVFINGVSVGRDWFQSNLDTLSLIFRRPIIGVHNITYGIIFDLLECLIQRDWAYATADIRKGYATVKEGLLDDRHKKVVLIVHSQGGIEGGAILDWLLDDLPTDRLRNLEIYTFGSAANHFNNPDRSSCPGTRKDGGRLGVVGRIEHYTNCGDFVARFGILGFIRLPTGTGGIGGSSGSITTATPKPKEGEGGATAAAAAAVAAVAAAAATGKATAPEDPDRAHDSHNNRFKGRLFKRNATGHMLNQHYLACMFERERYVREDGTTAERVADRNGFMDTEASPWDGGADAETLGWHALSSWLTPAGRWRGRGEDPAGPAGFAKKWESMVREDGVDLSGAQDEARRPSQLSRLWGYRNGMTPPPPPGGQPYIT